VTTIKKFTLAAAVLLLSLFSVGNANAADFSAEELNRMSEFISTFTTHGFVNFKTQDLENQKDHKKLLYFALYRNDGEWTYCYENSTWSSRIEAKYIIDSIKKYFNYDIKLPKGVKKDPGIGYDIGYDGKYYYTSLADPLWESTARVEKAETLPSGEILMTGILIIEQIDAQNGVFEALAKPHKFNGQDTWYIISITSKIDDSIYF
jgi:hypothetical protein